MSEVVTAPARVRRTNDDLHEAGQGGSLATTAASGVVATIDPELDFGAYEGAGLEGLRIEEQLTPFLAILQGLSPQLNRSKPEYLPEARMGMILNTATKALFDGDAGVEFLPVFREYSYTEWIPRDDYELPDGSKIRGGGGGFRGVHAPDDRDVLEAVANATHRFGKRMRFRPTPFRNAETEEDTILVEQFNLGLIYGAPNLTEINARRAMIAFTSTKIGVYKAFVTAADDIRYESGGRTVRPPLWAHRWRAITVPQTNKKGDFYNWQIRLAEVGPSRASLVGTRNPLYLMATEFHDQWKSGEVKADYAATDGSENNDVGDARDPKEIPF